MPLIDFGTIATIRPGDVGGPASGLSTSSQTNETDLYVSGQDQYSQDFPSMMDRLSRKNGIDGQIHGGYGSSSDGYNGDDGGSIVPMTAGMEGTTQGSPVAWWFAIGGILVAIKILAEKNGDEGEFRTIRIGATNILIITLSSVVGLTLLKWVFGIYKVPGISQIVEAV